ncbi:MAG: hypothetical protein JSS66_04290 [Armatimonadetes bacterium]|nr:hypothetical protein [Armatimonadota bacterium]
MRQTVFALVFAAAAAAHADLPAITWTGQLIDVNSQTGARAVIAQTNLTNTNSMAMAGGTILVATGGKIYSVNRNTGATNLVCTMSFADDTDIRGLAVDPNGKLWAVTNSSPSDKLWQVSTSTGAGTLVGETGMLGIQALDFDAFGQLWAWNVDPTQGVGLCRLNRRNGTGFDINPGVGNVTSIQSICFDANNNLYGANTALYRINQTTGDVQLVGGSLGDVRGIEADNAFDLYSIPTNVHIDLGRVDTGILDSLVENDGDVLRICKFIVPNRTAPPVVFEVQGHAPVNNLTMISFSITGRVTLPGSFKVDMEAANYPLGQFQLKSTGNTNTAFSTVGWTETSNPNDYVNTDGTVNTRVKVYPVGPQPSNNWCYEADQVRWSFKPFIG